MRLAVPTPDARFLPKLGARLAHRHAPMRTDGAAAGRKGVVCQDLKSKS
jgi:hypothetical protein